MEIAAAAGVPYTFERRQGSSADSILHAASIHAAAEPASYRDRQLSTCCAPRHWLGLSLAAAPVALPGTHHLNDDSTGKRDIVRVADFGLRGRFPELGPDDQRADCADVSAVTLQPPFPDAVPDASALMCCAQVQAG